MPLQDWGRLSAFVRVEAEWVFTRGEIVVEFARPATPDSASSECARSGHRNQWLITVCSFGASPYPRPHALTHGSIDDREPRRTNWGAVFARKL